MNALELDHALSLPVPVKNPDMIVVDYVEAFDGRKISKVFNHVLLDKRGDIPDVG
jgi:hypothetical protein